MFLDVYSHRSIRNLVHFCFIGLLHFSLVIRSMPSEKTPATNTVNTHWGVVQMIGGRDNGILMVY